MSAPEHMVQVRSRLRVGAHVVGVTVSFAQFGARCESLVLKVCDHLMDSDDGPRLERAWSWLTMCLRTDEGLPELDEVPAADDFAIERDLLGLITEAQAQVRRAIQ